LEKGRGQKVKKYRVISLINEEYKIYSKVITVTLQKIIEAITVEEKSGFRKGSLCAENTFILKQLVETHREFNHELHILL
jgi:hypothetical protein